jgi:hypothetical protein
LITVNVTASDRLDPSLVADPFPQASLPEEAWFWLLRPGVYDPGRGLDLSLASEDESSWGIII